MGDLRRIIAQNIKKARKAKGWTQTDLAIASGVSFRGLQDIETAKHTPRPETLRAISEALGITDQEIMSGSVVTTFANPSKSESIAAIVTALPSLDQSQLDVVLDLINGFATSNGAASRSDSSAR